ncbi:protein abnormal spindle [Anoplophora glabripennis]|uniref:protein abnormal spindle n=1 Tax=Anoplophora glabripennis TaxID=217634 RepID=UPI0008753929|nr:protein abnormal spindle [Anoplophora glabripennis]
MFFQFSPIRTKVKHASVPKENESEKIEVLSLAPFTPNPKLFFEDVQVGTAVNRKLLIENPTDHDVNIFITNHIPQELNVTINPEQITVGEKSSAILELTWCPLQEEYSRHTISVGDGKRIHRDVPVAFKSVLPKKKKTAAKQKRKPQPISSRQKSPLKSKTPPNKTSPTKKYYSVKPPRISPNRYSPQKKYSPPKTTSPTKKYLINIQKASPDAKWQNVSASADWTTGGRNTYKVNGKENVPSPLLNASYDNNVFVSPSITTFHLDYLQPIERRETYVINGKKDVSFSESHFSDSLENISPELSSRVEDKVNGSSKRQPLGISNQDNISPKITEYVQQKLAKTPTNYNFEYKLMQLESFCFTPVSTPLDQKQDFSPHLSSTVNKTERSATETVNVTQLFPAQNNTFDVSSKSPNISTETYVKSNLSAETYVKGNTSFETYVKNNSSGGTFTKDTSVGDVANLTFSPISSKPNTSPNISKANVDNSQSYLNLNGDNAKHVIEANLWSGIRSQPLSSIKEESYIHQSMLETNHTPNKSFLKRKSDLNFTFTPPKRPNVKRSPQEWSKSGGSAIRIVKKTTGLNLKKFLNNGRASIAEESDNAVAALAKQDTHQIIVQNPFLLAATNLADPFMTPHLYVNEEWLDQQQIDFKKWLNALLTPPVELNSEEHLVDVAKVWQECKKREVDVAPTKEIVSSKYLVNNKLNALRKSAQNLFKSQEMSSVLSKVVLAVETGKLMIREDKDVHLNLALKSEVMAMLLSYNPLWLRIGLETIYNEIIPLKSNSDVVGLSTFIANRVLKDPYLLKKHKLVHSSKYVTEFKKFFLKKFLVLVYFLDQAKNKKLIAHDPCLFCKNSSIKESKEMLIKLSREMLAAVGDITKYLKYTGYVVTHVQTYINEFDYAVNNLGVDLRDGVRLTKVMEIILMQENLTANLRVPAISRLQKIHNMKIVFSSLEKAGYEILYDISPKDIVDGHKEKTLSFLWQIVYKFQAPLMVKSATTIQTWFRSLPVVLKRRHLERVRLRREAAATKIQVWYRRQKISRMLERYISLLEKYLSLVKRQKAAVKIQSCYRRYRCLRLYKKQRNTVVNIQRFAKGWLIRNVRRNQIKKAVMIQSHIRMYIARKRFLELKKAVDFVQEKYRAKKKMEVTRTSYIQQKSAAITIQRWIRSIKLLKHDKETYEKLKTTVSCIQQRFRANRLCKTERKKYLEIRLATLHIQTWYRSIISMRVCRKQFLATKKSVLVIEQRYLALKAMRIEKRRYKDIKKACVCIQQQYKARREMKIQRRAYLELKTATVTIQNIYRANKASKKERRYFETLKSATILVQRKFRANRAMRTEYRSYTRLREATVKIQTWFRATMEMRKCLTYFVSLKYAVHIFEDRYQAKKLMEEQRRYYKELKSATVTTQRRYRALISMREARTEYTGLKTYTLFIQRKFRANKMARSDRTAFIKLKEAAIVVQSRYRAQLTMRECRKEYLALQLAAVVLQRRYRANCLMKTARIYHQNLVKYTLIVQRRFRANKAMSRQRDNYVRLRNSVVSLQQKWRAKKIGENQRQKFEALRKAALVVQRRWRANKLYHQEKTNYEVLKKTAVNVQRIWRAKKLGEKEKSDYIRLKNAATVLQRAWRAKSLKEKHHREYTELKTTAIFLQRRWRSIKLTRRHRTEFTTLRRTVVSVQQRWRANKLARKERRSYLQLRNAAITVQVKRRAKKLMERYRNEFVLLKNATVCIQRRWRANKLARQEKTTYEALKTAVVNIQVRWRSKQLAKKERLFYLQRKSAANVLQSRWRAKVIGNRDKQRYEALKKTTIFVQRKWRANKLARKERIMYEKLKHQVITIQRLWRAITLTKIEKENYHRLKTATVLIQHWWRAHKIGTHQKIQYGLLRKTTVSVQRRWRANILTRTERTRYAAMRDAAIVIQSHWRMRQARNGYLRLRENTIKIQRMWRTKKLCKQHKSYYESLRKTTLFIQRRWRANRLARAEKAKYETLKRSAIVLQRRWRAKKQVERDRGNYIRLRTYAVVLQRRWRARKMCKQLRNEYETLKATVIMVQRTWRLKKVYEYDRNSYLELKKAAVAVQQKWRAQLLKRSAYERYTLLKYHVLRVQVRYRAKKLMKQQREWYLKAQTSAGIIQRFYRGYRCMKQLQAEMNDKRRVVVGLQRLIRGCLVRRKYAYFFTPEEREKRRSIRMERAAAIKIQAMWRGHRSRAIDTPKLINIRQRAHKANLKAVPEDTLGNRCREALQALVNEKSTVFGVNKALQDLDYITRHSQDVCQEVAQFLPEQMYLMIKTTNRSLPEMRACILSVNILINVCKYPPTRPYSFFPEYIDNFVTIMMHWCDKEALLFPSMCTLLWLFAHNPEWRKVIGSLPNIEQRLSKIQSQVSRKQSMVRRAGAKGQSLFAPYETLPLPSLEPDWGLAYKYNPYIFTNSVHAFSSLLCILNL